MSEIQIKPDETLDLKGVSCPINYVKTKLKLETMQSGQILEVILDDGQPIKNVPLSLKQDGHEIILQEKMSEKHWKILVKKNNDV